MAQTAIPQQNALGQLFSTPEYQSAVSQQKTGNIMLGVGVVVFLVGLILAIIGRRTSKIL